jgi:hypothetical protein
MVSRIGRWALVSGTAMYMAAAVPVAAPAYAAGWAGGGQSCWGREGRDRARCERDAARDNGRWGDDRNRRDWERKRRNDAKTDGIVAGVVGTAVIAGIIAAASSDKKKRNERDRRDYCIDRYGNYDARTDSYRASDGSWYRCE